MRAWRRRRSRRAENRREAPWDPRSIATRQVDGDDLAVAAPIAGVGVEVQPRVAVAELAEGEVALSVAEAVVLDAAVFLPGAHPLPVPAVGIGDAVAEAVTDADEALLAGAEEVAEEGGLLEV